jgi:hypothetical protein
VAARLVEVDGVVAVSLGGSRAQGTNRPDSDWDVGIYYRQPLDIGGLRAVAAESGFAGQLTELGGWGPWTFSTGTWTASSGSRLTVAPVGTRSGCRRASARLLLNL